VLYLDPAANTGDTGVVIVVERSRFAPPQVPLDAFRSGGITVDQFVASY